MKKPRVGYMNVPSETWAFAERRAIGAIAGSYTTR